MQIRQVLFYPRFLLFPNIFVSLSRNQKYTKNNSHAGKDYYS